MKRILFLIATPLIFHITAPAQIYRIAELNVELALFHALAAPAAASDSKLTMISSRIEVYLQERGWQLDEKLVWDEVVYHIWRSKQELIKVSFFYMLTEQQAADRLQKDIAGITTKLGKGTKVEGMGDEGYEWTQPKEEQVVVNVRTGRVLVAVVGKSTGTARQMAKTIAELLSESLGPPSRSNTAG